jgi:hypothetical protein
MVTNEYLSGGEPRVITLAGSPGNSGEDNGNDSTARFHGPTGIALDPRTDGRDLLVTDHSSDRLRRVRITGGHEAPVGARAEVATLAAGTSVSGIRGISSFCAINDCFYVVREPTRPPPPHSLSCQLPPRGFARPHLFSPPLPPPPCHRPSPPQTLWGRHQVCQVKVDPSEDAARVTRVAGSPDGSSGSAIGTGDAARFDHPRAVEVASSGEVYVGDTRNNVVRRVVVEEGGLGAPRAIVSTLCGSGQAGNAPGSGAQAGFTKPSTLSWTTEGALLMADEDNCTLWQLQ